MKVVNLYGGPSSGKSATAAGVFYHMKLQNYSVDLVTEYAKELVWEGRLDDMLDKQEDIFIEQQRRIRRLRDNVDYAIVDSPLLLSCIYPKMNELQKGVDRWPALNAFLDFVVAVNDTYDNINIFLQRPSTFETNGRDHNLEESQEIDEAIINGLTELNQTWITMGTNDMTVQRILTHISSYV
jgi:nicotinamide riboside kinase